MQLSHLHAIGKEKNGTILYNESKHNVFALVGKANKQLISYQEDKQCMITSLVAWALGFRIYIEAKLFP